MSFTLSHPYQCNPAFEKKVACKQALAPGGLPIIKNRMKSIVPSFNRNWMAKGYYPLYT